MFKYLISSSIYELESIVSKIGTVIILNESEISISIFNSNHLINFKVFC